MYGNPEVTQWHTEKFGPPDKFGYKDFIPMFTAAKWDPDAWAELFKNAGAKFIIPTAEHHDGFALWDSAVNPWNAKQMGPHRDLIGDLSKAVRKQGLKFGVSNHGIEHFTFIQPTAGQTNDLYDPKWKDFYSVADRSDAACEKFLESWVAQNEELIDKYQPDILWFDNGVNGRVFDPIKLKVAAYYYNRAATWGKPVSLETKDSAYLAGSVEDFERSSREPKELTDFVWDVDEPVLYRFGYTENSPIASANGLRAAARGLRQQKRRAAAEHFAEGRRHDSRRPAKTAAANRRLARCERRGDLRDTPVETIRRGQRPLHHQRRHALRHFARLADEWNQHRIARHDQFRRRKNCRRRTAWPPGRAGIFAGRTG